MLIIQGKALVNLDNLFSMTIGGQGERYLICKGNSSLEVHLVFKDGPTAIRARNIIATKHDLKEGYCYIDKWLDLEGDE